MAIPPRGGRKSVQNFPTRDDGTRVSEKEGTVSRQLVAKRREGPEPSELSKKCESAVLLLLLRKIVYRLIGAFLCCVIVFKSKGEKVLPLVPRNPEDSGTHSELGRSSGVIRIPELPSAAGHGLLIITELITLGYQRERRGSQLRKIQRI